MDGNEKPRGYRDLLVWQTAMDLAGEVYGLTARFPGDERSGLVAQMRRAAVAIPSNIAEGRARHTSREFMQFISHAEGSLAEIDTQLLLSKHLGYCKEEEAERVFPRIAEVRKMLMSLRGRVNGQKR